MLIKNIIAFCLILPLVAFAAKPIPTEELEIIPEVLTPTEYISMYANQFGVSENILLSVAKCESKLNPNAIHYNDGGKGKHSIGIFQFQESTFNTWEKKLGENLDYYSYKDQAKLAAYMFSRKQEGQWSCYRIIKGL